MRDQETDEEDRENALRTGVKLVANAVNNDELGKHRHIYTDL
jgi:hypothetical protein